MSKLRPTALLQAFMTASSAFIRVGGRGGAALRTPSTLRMAQVDTGGLGAPDICVLGGGFGGVYTALGLSKLDWGDSPRPRITLVDQQDRFVFLPMLYEVTTGTASCWEVAPQFEEVLAGSGIEFVQGTVAGLDTESRLVRVTGATPGEERSLPYDACVLALGAEAKPNSVPGAAEHARRFYTLDDALALRRELQALRAQRRSGMVRVAVVGSGYVGTELSANLASWLGPNELMVTLVGSSDSIVHDGLPFSRGVAKEELDARGIELVLDTKVSQVDAAGLTLQPAGDASPYRLEADLVVWTAGTRPAAVACDASLPVAEDGRLAIEPTLAVRGSPRLFALGDMAACADGPGGVARSPSTAQAAMQQADYAAWNVRAALRGDEALLPYRYANLGEMLSLGDAAGSVSSLGLINLKGPLASAARRAIYAARMPTPQIAARVGLSWGLDTVLSAVRRATKDDGKK